MGRGEPPLMHLVQRAPHLLNEPAGGGALLPLCQVDLTLMLLRPLPSKVPRTTKPCGDTSSIRLPSPGLPPNQQEPEDHPIPFPLTSRVLESFRVRIRLPWQHH